MLNVIRSFVANREFAWEMAKRDLKGMTKGSFLGYLWTIIGPLIQVGVWVVLFAFIFQTKLGQDSSRFGYVIYVLSGMIPWQLLTRSVGESPSIILGRIDLVKQVVYPVETLPLTSLLVGSTSAAVSLVILLILGTANGMLSWTTLLLPLPALLLLMFLMGTAWFFSIIGVFVKDLRDAVGVLLSLLVYASPVIIKEDMVAGWAWRAVMLNPLAHPVICFRDVFFGTWHPLSWMVFVTMSVSAFLVGGMVMGKAKVLINEYI